jgi:hypothetical protein
VPADIKKTSGTGRFDLTDEEDFSGEENRPRRYQNQEESAYPPKYGEIGVREAG